MLKKYILLLLLLFFTVSGIFAEEGQLVLKRNNKNRVEKPELGFWLGASSPVPGSAVHGMFDTALGFGMFTRFLWPFNSLHTEIGASYTSYLSSTERRLIAVPIYGALAYEYRLSIPVSFFFKLGGGSAYLTARPANVYGWDPLIYAGFEVGFVAAKKVRIGLRLDYNKFVESWSEQPEETKWLYLTPYRDLRLYNPNDYKKVDAEFFHFALMISVFM